MEIEQRVICPTCWQEFTVILDRSVPRQVYIQDCEVCCNPIEISYEVRGGRVIFFDAKALDA